MVRDARTRWTVFTLLSLCMALEAGAFLDRADACRFMRMALSERPTCCDLGGQDRFTRTGGDCCKYLDIEEVEPAGTVSFDHVVASARLAPALVSETPEASRVGAPSTIPAAFERPPPLPPPTETVVLLI